MHGDFLQSIHEPHVDDWVFGKTVDSVSPRSKSLHWSFFDAEWNVDCIFSHRQTSAHWENQHPEGVCGSLPANNAVTRVSYCFLHLYTSAAWRRPTMESRCFSSLRHLQTTLVEKSPVHPQLVRLLQHVFNAHTSRRNWHRTFLDCSVFDSFAVEVAKEGNTIDNGIGGSVDNCSILRHIYTWTVKLCLLWNKVNQLKRVKRFKLNFVCSVKQLFETADKMYIMPHHRFTVYAMGIGLGYVLRMFKDMKLTQSQLKIGWYLSIVSLLLAFFGPAPMGDIDYKYDATQASHYAAFAPIAWCVFFGWIILVTQLGYKSKFSRFVKKLLCEM